MPRMAMTPRSPKVLETMSRQLVVPVPSTLHARSQGSLSKDRRGANLQRASRIPQPDARDGTHREEQPAEKQTAEKQTGEKSDGDERSGDRPPELVRMLIIVESASPAAAASEKSAEK